MLEVGTQWDNSLPNIYELKVNVSTETSIQIRPAAALNSLLASSV